MVYCLKLLSFVIALVMIAPETAISAGGDTLCKDWDLAGRTFYPDKHDLYDGANKWIIGQVFGEPIWSSSEIGKLINSMFAVQRPFDVSFRETIMGVTNIALGYCRTHPNDTIAVTAKQLSAPQDKEKEKKRIEEKADAIAKTLQQLQNQERLMQK